jgi:F-type H+-transporting ATPase subunit b
MSFLLFAADEPNSVHLPGDINEVYWGSIAFFVVVGLLVWKAGPAVKAALARRTQSIRDEISAAEIERRDAESRLAAQRAEIGDIGSERQRLLTEAGETAERLKVDVVARARTEAESLRTRALADIEAQRNQAMGDLRAEVARLTRGAAEAVVRDNLDDASQKQLIDSYIERVRQLA